MSDDRKFIGGHKTMIDGTHVPLSEDEAREIWKRADERKAARAVSMPTAEAALSALIEAEERLRELGWWPGGGLKVRRGDDCAVAQKGSTGMWRGHVDSDGTYVNYADSVSKPRDAYLKPLADLTPDERAHMERCDQNEAEAMRAMFDRFASIEGSRP